MLFEQAQGHPLKNHHTQIKPGQMIDLDLTEAERQHTRAPLATIPSSHTHGQKAIGNSCAFGLGQERWDLNPRPILMQQAIPLGIASTVRSAALHGCCKLGAPTGLSWRRLTVVCNESSRRGVDCLTGFAGQSVRSSSLMSRWGRLDSALANGSGHTKIMVFGPAAFGRLSSPLWSAVL
jgi:hypothetical protein